MKEKNPIGTKKLMEYIFSGDFQFQHFVTMFVSAKPMYINAIVSISNEKKNK